jgi:hypothetical protein
LGWGLLFALGLLFCNTEWWAEIKFQNSKNFRLTNFAKILKKKNRQFSYVKYWKKKKKNSCSLEETTILKNLFGGGGGGFFFKTPKI